jgi:uncharacterized membrane protein YjjP (DUF1212 family)
VAAGGVSAPPGAPAGTAAAPPPAIAFLLALLRALHAFGTPAHRLEAVAGALAARFGFEAHVFSTPTAVLAAFGPPGAASTTLLRVEPGGIHLDKLAALDRVVDDVCAGRIEAGEASRRVEAVVARPDPYAPWIAVLCFALSGVAVARFLGGGGRDLAVAALCGLVVGLLAELARRRAGFARVLEPAAAVAAAALGVVGAGLLGAASPRIAAIAGLIVLVPGFSITVAMTELSTRHLVSGTTRLAGATMTFMLIGFGVALGGALGSALAPGVSEGTPVPLPEWTRWACVPLACLSLTVLFRAPLGAFAAILAVGFATFATARAAGEALGPELGMLLGALVAGGTSNLASRRLDQPAATTLVPAILLLVPGSLGLRSIASMAERDVVLGVELAFRLVLLAVALAAGLVTANVALPPRRSL